MDTELLARRIRLGEDSKLELKRVLLAGRKVRAPERTATANELAAMANARGGRLVLGVDDRTRNVLGIPVERIDAVEGWVREICNDSINPPLEADINKMELPNASGDLTPVIEVVVPRSLFVHESPGGYFVRIGSSKRKLAPEVLARLFQERSQSRIIRFDETPVPGSSPADIDAELVRRFLHPDAEVSTTGLRKLGVVAHDEDGAPRITVSGALLCTRNPSTWLPHAMIQAVSYAGERHDVNYQLDAREFGGPLDDQIFAALHFVRRNMLMRATKRTGRVEFPQFSDRVVFEAVANAVAHRDYSMGGARIRLHMFADRIELFVPGALANTLTPDSMHLRQYSRNELIVSLLARCPLPPAENLGRSRIMDRRGDGVPVIQKLSLELSGRLPEYELIDESELRLVVWGAPAPVPTERGSRA